MKNITAVAGLLGMLGAAVAWLHSTGALPAGLLFWLVIGALIGVLSYGVSWGVTEARKRLCIPKPWSSDANRRAIYRTAMLWAALPAGSAAVGIGLSQDVPVWGWFVVPWLVLLFAVSSPWAWRLVFEVLLPWGKPQ